MAKATRRICIKRLKAMYFSGCDCLSVIQTQKLALIKHETPYANYTRPTNKMRLRSARAHATGSGNTTLRSFSGQWTC
jgi:hypothetical protein